MNDRQKERGAERCTTSKHGVDVVRHRRQGNRVVCSTSVSADYLVFMADFDRHNIQSSCADADRCGCLTETLSVDGG